MSCEECRAGYEEDDRDPPCEGRDCPIGAVELLPENRLAVELHRLISRLGAPLAMTLVDLKLTSEEALGLADQLCLCAEADEQQRRDEIERQRQQQRH